MVFLGCFFRVSLASLLPPQSNFLVFLPFFPRCAFWGKAIWTRFITCCWVYHNAPLSNGNFYVALTVVYPLGPCWSGALLEFWHRNQSLSCRIISVITWNDCFHFPSAILASCGLVMTLLHPELENIYLVCSFSRSKLPLMHIFPTPAYGTSPACQCVWCTLLISVWLSVNHIHVAVCSDKHIHYQITIKITSAVN